MNLHFNVDQIIENIRVHHAWVNFYRVRGNTKLERVHKEVLLDWTDRLNQWNATH